MIQANELRIGNLVMKETGYIFEADFITLKMAHNYQPIPLTEEWLLKFKDKVDYEISDSGDSVFIRINGPDINEIDTERVKYVHSLQNLYFALTGEELIIKES